MSAAKAGFRALVVSLLALGLSATWCPPILAGESVRPPAPGILLITLDTTRADFPGYAGGPAETPTLDRLVADGTRWNGALTPSPLTLPAHASLLTGLDPPEHGVRDNGIAVLGDEVPTVAGELSAAGWQTAAFVASRVLDRRFGLGRGFDLYDDRMAAEALGEYGYPERDARSVTDAALGWLRQSAGDRPLLLWVHYYDPHAPYAAPGVPSGRDERTRYAEEIAYVDRQLARLIAAFESRPGRGWVAVVADHGESLGEHGERAHGIFLYTASLAVPMILSGPGVESGKTVEEMVSTRRLAPTLLALAGRELPTGMPPRLPGIRSLGKDPAPQPVFSETRLPLTAYGWSPLEALSEAGWRLIVAPRPELYDLQADPAESRNLLSAEATDQESSAPQSSRSPRRRARSLKQALDERRESFSRHQAGAAEDDPELAATLRSLGYATGARGEGDGLDPKDGIGLLTELEEAKALLGRRNTAAALEILERLVARNPSNIPMLRHKARALLAAGRQDEALATFRKAVSLNPRLDFLHVNLADAYAHVGRLDQARQEYELALELNPRNAQAWLRLAELAKNGGDSARERSLLTRAVAAGTASAGVLARLGQIEMEAGEARAAERFAEVTRLSPEWAMGWLLRGQWALQQGDATAARPFLEEALRLDPRGPAGRQARAWLGGG